MTNEQIIARLEKEFKERLDASYPDLDMKYFELAFDSFQKGLWKGQIMIHNRVAPEIQLQLFEDGTTGMEDEES